MTDSYLFANDWYELIRWTVLAIGYITSLVIIGRSNHSIRKTSTGTFTILIAITFILLFGFTPLGIGTGNDRDNYTQIFQIIKQYGLSHCIYEHEIGFNFITWLLSKFVNVQGYFVAIAAIYVGNYLISAHKLSKKASFYLLVSAIVSMGFTSYNVNTMRSGLALSFLVLALSMYPSKIKMAVCMVLASSIHNSTIIPATIMFLCLFYDKTKLYYYLWFIAVPLSFIAGNHFNILFAGIFEEERTSYLISNGAGYYTTGFRIDFIIYSLVPMVIGAYYIFKRHFKDKLYNVIYNTYILCNIFWVLVIRANFSDRFAYLSWFLIPFVLTYPLTTELITKNQNKKLALIIFCQTLFITII